MAFFVLAMLAYPETQALAYAELDAVVGRTRLPTFADLPHLPYIRAMVKELLRWRLSRAACHATSNYRGRLVRRDVHSQRDNLYAERVEYEPATPRFLVATRSIFDPGAVSRCPWRIGAWSLSDLRKEGHFSYGFGSRKLRWAPCGRQLAFHQHCGVAMDNEDRT